MPDRIALWLALDARQLMKPAAQPINAPPGKLSFGTDCQPPSVMARAPYERRLPPANVSRIKGCVLKRWNSSKGDSVGFE